MSDLGFGEALRLVRRARGLTQAQLAEKAKLTRTHLSRIEGAREWPTHYRNILGALRFGVGAELMTAARAERERLAKRREQSLVPCDTCGSPMPPLAARRGRPRKRCASCASDSGQINRRWRAANVDRIRAYKARRRVIDNAQQRQRWARNADAINAKRRRRYAAARGVER